MASTTDSPAAKKAALHVPAAPQVNEVIRSIQETERVIERLVFEKELSGPSARIDARHRSGE